MEAINYTTREASLYFKMYLNFKEETLLIKAFNVDYLYTTMLCIENGIYFEAACILRKQLEIEPKSPILYIV